MIVTKSRIGLKKKFEALPEQTKSYLRGIEALLDDPSTFGVALAFAFMKVEEGQHRALKCGLIRELKCKSSRVDDALGKQHFTRAYFRMVFKNVFREEISAPAIEAIGKAEKVRDKLIHGKTVTAPDLRTAISFTFDYISALGGQVEKITKKNPFGNLQGLASRTKLMDDLPSFWLLKGLGFYNDKTTTAQ